MAYYTAPLPRHQAQHAQPQNARPAAPAQAPAVQPAQQSVLRALGERYGIEPMQLYSTLKQTVFKDANESEFVTLCLVAKEYNLNPLLKEIYAFRNPKGGGIAPIVGIDGYIRLMNEHPAFDGIEYKYADNIVTFGGSKPCSEWIEAVIWRKDRSRPTVCREYLEECFRNTDPWRMNTRRMLRHKATAQAVRLAFGFSGVYADAEDVPETLPAATVIEEQPKQAVGALIASEAAKAAEPKQEPAKRGRKPKASKPAEAVPESKQEQAQAPQPAPEPEEVIEAVPVQEPSAQQEARPAASEPAEQTATPTPEPQPEPEAPAPAQDEYPMPEDPAMIEQGYIEYLADCNIPEKQAWKTVTELVNSGQCKSTLEAKWYYQTRGLGA